MRIRQLEHAVAVVDRGSVAAAANALRCPASTVAQSVRALEKELDMTLFVRSGTQVLPTLELHALVPDMRAALRSAQVTRASVGDTELIDADQILTIAVDLSVPGDGLMPLVAALRRRRPAARVRMVTTTAGPAEALALGACDLVSLGRRSESLRAESGLSWIRIGAHRRWLVLPTGNTLPSNERVRLADLRDVPHCPVITEPSGPLAESCRELGIGVMLVDHREAHLPLTLAGLGACVVDDLLAEHARALGHQVRRLEFGEHLEHTLAFDPGQLTPLARAFIDLAAATNSSAVAGMSDRR